MISVAEALAKVVEGVSLVSTEQVPLPAALGRVLAEDVKSRVSHPPVAVSAMDGYAVCSGDVEKVPVTLKQIGLSAAGGGFDGSVGPGETVRIFTGAPVPGGADAIVIQEHTETDADAITVKEAAPEGRFIRPAGLDFRQGDVLLPAATVLSARDIGLAGAMNVPWLTVRRRPRVAYAATGDEVVMPGDPLGPGQIISSNSVALDAYIRVLGGEPLNLGIARDNEESLRRVLDGAKGADLLVTIGGASVGDFDLVKKVLGDDGMDLGFYKVAMRPGKPLIFGRLNGIPVLGLPGNPVSAGVTSVIFLKAAIAEMLGIGNGGGGPRTALLGRGLEQNDQRQDYLRAKLSHDKDGRLVATPFEGQDSSMMARLAEADCLVVRPPNAKAANKGEPAEIIPLGGGLGGGSGLF
ncbi:MAG: molybdopterin molybdenumtransferase MoeA [Rhodospirillaceae bacterium]|jgi:molybdopterin molybdotransferase|nr:molybdopterin molybdenumtransferase MoeA [Rhodospirillaceae bacterium]|tara:strand:- start:73 stop:1299 length:1227 start_codon:yes stop_codon:yes gene_type:complete